MKFSELLAKLLMLKINSQSKTSNKGGRKTRKGDKLDRAMSRHGNVYGHRWGTK